MSSDSTNKDNSVIGYKMSKWHNVLERIYWHRHAVMHYNLRVISGKMSQLKHLLVCSDMFQSFKMPWLSPVSQRKP